MKVTLKQVGEGAHFEATNSTGQRIELHAGAATPEEQLGMSPMESLLSSIAGCSAVDIVFMMEKMRQGLDYLEVEVDSERKSIKDAKPFSKVHLHYIFHGDVEPSKASRASELAVTKYCSVIESLNPDIVITWKCMCVPK